MAAVAASSLAGSDDLTVFRAALHEDRILITYDSADFTLLFGDLLREGVRIPGLVFVDSRTLPPSDVGGLARALAVLAARIETGAVDPSGGLFLTKG